MYTRFIIYIFILCITAFYTSATDYSSLRNKLKDIIATKDANIGIALIINSRDTICINNNAKYPMMSVFKFHQAIAVAKYLEQNNISLDTTLFISKTELNPNTYSPLYSKFPNQDINISIKDLLNYTLQLSDNNACDILFNHIIRPNKADSLLKTTGITDFSISATEKDMSIDINSCYKNWTTPLATSKFMNLLIDSNLLSTKYKDFIINSMIGATTGENRIPKHIKNTSATIGHKTGTSGKNENGEFIGINDVGFIITPQGDRICISVFIKNSKEEIPDCEFTISEISKIVYNFVTVKNE